MSTPPLVKRLLPPLSLIALLFCPAQVAGQTAPAEGDSLPTREGHFTGADGVQLYYRLVGSGTDTVVVLHGGPGTGMREGFDLEGLSGRGHALLLYDQRGAGQSELVSSAARLTLAAHVADLEALRRHFRFTRLSLVGLSWGSAIALHYAIAHPGATDRLVFLSPLPPTGRFFVQRFARLDSLRPADVRVRLRTIDSLWSGAGDAELVSLCRENARATEPAYQESRNGPRGDSCDYPAQVLRHRRLARVAAMTALGAEYDFAAALRRLTGSVLVIDGDRSKLPLEATRYWVRHAGNARLLLLANSGHRTWIDRPEALVAAIDIFLRGDWPPRAQKISQE